MPYSLPQTFEEAFERKRVNISKMLDLDHGLLIHLRDNKLITTEQLDTIKRKSTNTNTCLELLMILERGDGSRLVKFLELLVATNQKHVADFILGFPSEKVIAVGQQQPDRNQHQVGNRLLYSRLLCNELPDNGNDQLLQPVSDVVDSSGVAKASIVQVHESDGHSASAIGSSNIRQLAGAAARVFRYDENDNDEAAVNHLSNSFNGSGAESALGTNNQAALLSVIQMLIDRIIVPDENGYRVKSESRPWDVNAEQTKKPRTTPKCGVQLAGAAARLVKADENAEDETDRSRLSTSVRHSHSETALLADSQASSCGRRGYFYFYTRQTGESNLMSKRSIETHSSVLYGEACLGRLHYVKIAVENGADVNASNEDGITPLYAAAQCGHLEIVQYLVDRGASVNARTNRLSVPIIVAAGKGHRDVVKYLIEKGAAVNDADDYGHTALHAVVADCGHIDVIQLLIDSGANMNAENMYDITPLFRAAREGRLKCVKYLHKRGAYVHRCNKGGVDPIQAASAEGHYEVVKYLIEQGASVNVADNKNITALMAAAHEGHMDVVRLLVDNGATVDAADNKGFTPLGFAAKSDRLDVVRYLLENGASIDKPTLQGFTALIAAADAGHSDMVTCLLENGASVNAANQYGYTSLHMAASKGHRDVVRMLVEKRATVDATEFYGYTPLHIAASAFPHLDIVQYLVECGASVNQATHDGSTPLSSARSHGCHEIARYLIQKGASIDAEVNCPTSGVHQT